MEFLPEDVYSFLGYEIGIRSNSHDVLSHIRSVYGCFYQGCDEALLSNNNKHSNTPRHSIEIIDKLANSNELIIKDSFYLCCLSRYDKYYRWTCQDIKNTLAYNLSGACDPLTFIQAALLRTFTLLAKDFQFIHAGSVSWQNKGIIFPANPNMGKTTIVLKLVMSGCKFLSDELACLHPDRDIIEPFPRRVSIRHNSQELLGLPIETFDVNYCTKTDEEEWIVDIKGIVPDSLSNPCKLSYIFFLHGFGEKPRLEYISSSNALFKLFKFSEGSINEPVSLLFKYAPLLNKIQSFNLVIGNIDETTELIMQEVCKGEVIG